MVDETNDEPAIEGQSGAAGGPADEALWQSALATYEKMEMGRRKVELTSIIRPIVERLSQEALTVAALHEVYHGGDDWWLAVAKDGYPDQPRLWEKHRTADVAYGIRYRQLTSGQDHP